MGSLGSSRIARRPRYLLTCCALLWTAASGCTRTVQAWPPPLDPGDPVVIRFATSRSIVFAAEAGHDSAAEVRELRGRVVSQHADTLVVRVTRDAPGTTGGDRSGRSATVVLDSNTLVTRSEVDGWKVGYGILAAAVLIFAGLVMSGS
jgi:hypothetical protein